MSTKLNQKDYLKKYLSGDKSQHKKKKRKVKDEGKPRVKIIDDDVDIVHNKANDIEELILTGEDAPQIVGIIDDRPAELKTIEDFRSSGKWRSVSQNVSIYTCGSKKNSENFNVELKVQRNRDKQNGNQRQRSPSSNYNLSPKCKKSNQEDSGDLSPKRNKNSREYSEVTNNRDCSDDLSPRRKGDNRESNRDLDLRRKRNNQNRSEDFSPKWKKDNQDRSEDHSPKRKKDSQESDEHLDPRRKGNSRNSGEDFSSRRKKDNRELSEGLNPRRRGNNRDRSEDHSPKRKKINRDHSGDLSPRRKKDTQESNEDLDQRRRRNNQDCNEDLNSRPRKTLEGKKAGLQDAKTLRQESEKFRKQENELFKKMSKDISGKDAEIAVRDSSNKHRKERAAINRDLEEEERKMELEKHKQEIYNRWGKGLKQIEDYKNKIADEEHEMSKPLARYSDDVDLDEILKKQDREGDPMLDYIKKKSKSKRENVLSVPVYEGSFPENRFNIRPGYRWDGVDRSNGYEKRWFEVQNKKKAIQEEAYKYSTEDM